MRVLNAETIGLIKQWESFVAYAYDDADGSRPPKPIDWTQGVTWRGTLTIGYGHTGPDVRPGLRIDQAQAEALLRQDLAPCCAAVEAVVSVPLSDNQFGAMVSFAFNAGTGALASSTLLKRLNAGDYAAVPAELMRWTKTTIDGRLVVSPGLANRRAAEAGLWARGSFVAGAGVDAAPATGISGKHVAAAATAGVASTPAIATVIDTIGGSSYQLAQAQSWLGQHTWLGYLVGGVLLAGIGYLVYLAWRRARAA
jgi:lysozyme